MACDLLSCPIASYAMRMAFSILSIALTIPHSQTDSPRLVSCGNAVSKLCERSAQSILHDLAGGVRRQLVEEHYISRDLVTGHSLAAPLDQFVPVDLTNRRARHDERLADLPEAIIGHADNRGLRHRRVFGQEALDLGGIGIEAANDEHVLLATHDAQPARVGELAEIAGVQPTVVIDRVSRCDRVVEVALHHAVATHQYFAVLGDADLDAVAR